MYDVGNRDFGVNIFTSLGIWFSSFMAISDLKIQSFGEHFSSNGLKMTSEIMIFAPIIYSLRVLIMCNFEVKSHFSKILKWSLFSKCLDIVFCLKNTTFWVILHVEMLISDLSYWNFWQKFDPPRVWSKNHSSRFWKNLYWCCLGNVFCQLWQCFCCFSQHNILINYLSFSPLGSRGCPKLPKKRSILIIYFLSEMLLM